MFAYKQETDMCMGCGTTLLQSAEIKAPDTVDTVILFMGFMMWVIMLNHIAKKLKLTEAGSLLSKLKKGSD